MAVSWLLNGVFTTPDVVVGHGSESAALIVIGQLVADAPLPSVTLIVIVPAAFGVPLNRPELLSVRPSRLPVAE
jgi:hypothetical protein